MTAGTFAHAPDAAGRADARARAFAVARRHTRRVRAARRTLEIGVVLVVAGFAAMVLLRNFGQVLRGVSFEGIGLEGGRITMDKPHLTGSHPGGGGYNITAVKAMQDGKHPGDVDLALIGGDISMPDREVSRLSAQSGHYESATEALALAGDVRLTNSRYEVYLQSVRIDFKKGEYVSSEPAKVHILPDTSITADSFRVEESGAVARFEGHVHTLIKDQDASLGAPR
jgi:lipopolysaccharide export system protein LptC